jgi:hypothetical protein
MPIPAPILDDRSYQQLRDELVRRIPVYAPEWTDVNASDPGVALVELFAFLGENLLFRFNQIPETTQLEFLRLLGVPLRPAVPARGLVTFSTAEPAGALVAKKSELAAGALPFETLTETVAWPISCVGVSRSQSGLPEDPAIQAYAHSVVGQLRLRGNETAVYYANAYVAADPAAPGAASVDFSLAVDRMVWIAVLGERGADLSRMLGHTLSVGVVPDQAILPTDPLPPACPGAAGTGGASGPALTWQVSTGRVAPDGRPVYKNLAVVSDTTRGLTKEGVVGLRLPKEPSDVGVFPPPRPDMGGTRDLPPELERDADRKKLLFWIRAFRDDGGRFARLLWLGVNVAEAEQAKSAPTEFLGTGTGQAHQRAVLAKGPVVDGSVVVEVEEPGGWALWRQVNGLFASSEDDRAYVLDPEAGAIRFGDGVRGRAPQIGERMRATTYRFGGGRAGNVAPKAVNKLVTPATRLDSTASVTVTVANPLPARGGEEAEAIGGALDRVPGELRRRDRAVTAGDFRELALATPGADVGRAECLPLRHPLRPDVDSPGVVSVVVWPREDRTSPEAPMPDRTLVRSVCSWLDLRRLVTTELHVVPPVYREIAVSVGLEVKPGYGVEAVRRWVELVLRQYLAPLPPYGPDGAGWPLGRPVLAAELQAAALQVEGVRFLVGLRLAQKVDAHTWAEAPEQVELAEREVPKLGTVTVVADRAPDAAELELTQPPPPPGPDGQPLPPEVFVPVPIPTVQC